MEYVPPINGNLVDPNRPYINANPGVSQQGSIPPAEAIEHPMREILQVITGAGITPDGDDLTQLYDAIQILIAGGGVTDLVTGTTANTLYDYTMAHSIVSLGSAYTKLFIINFNVANPSGGTATLNINSIGAKEIKDLQGNTLTQNRLPAGPRLMVYDGTAFRAFGLANPIIHVRDEKAAGTNGGTFTSGAWQTRTLNTVVLNQITGASLSSDQITLPAGVYRARGRAPAQSVNRNRARFYNVTDSSVIMFGDTSDITQTSTINAEVNGIFTLTGTKAIKLEHICQSTNSGGGFGAGGNLGINEVFAEVIIERLS